ncbi:MAG: 6-pyruvoyl trahydropterin synthase family protein [Candidatus Marinamargulisbacteria bacterium]
MKLLIQRRETFCASHRLVNPDLTEAENKELFKKCATIHGHNYVLNVAVSGDVDKNTGMIIAFEDMKKAIGDVVERFDHTNLNDHEFFLNRPTTVENFAQLLWDQVESELVGKAILERVELFETEKNSVILTR